MTELPEPLLSDVSDSTNVPRDLILSDRRTSEVVYARALLVLLLHRHMAWQHRRIARAIGRHHSSVYHTIQVAEDLLVIDPTFRNIYNRLAQSFA